MVLQALPTHGGEGVTQATQAVSTGHGSRIVKGEVRSKAHDTRLGEGRRQVSHLREIPFCHGLRECVIALEAAESS